MDTVLRTFNDLHLALKLGDTLAQPPGHFIRLVSLFSASERVKLLQQAYDFYTTVYRGEYSTAQFVAYVLSSAGASPDTHGFIHTRPFPHVKVNLDRLSPTDHAIVTSTCAGTHPPGLAHVLCNTLLGTWETFSDDVIRLVSTAIGTTVDRPELAAAITRCLSHNETLVSIFQSEARALADCAMLIPDHDFALHQPNIEVHDDDTRFSPELVDYRDHLQRGKHVDVVYDFDVEDYAWSSYFRQVYSRSEITTLAEKVTRTASDEKLTTIERLHKTVRDRLDLPGKFKFVESEYGLLIPVSLRPRLNATFINLIRKAKEDRSHLLSLSPRAFEQFIADLFAEMGYNVELTKATRDGGADIVCIQNLNGIPLRLAVEVKRYKMGSPITVELVRSFVGANEQFRANKLIYVTTSSYTRPALEYAERYASHLLTLKDYEQVKDWCDQVGRQKWTLIG